VINEHYKIELDLDRDRIKSILSEVYLTCKDILSVTFNITSEEFISQIDKFLNSNRVSISVLIPLPSDKYPDLKIEVNLRNKKVIARMSNRVKRILINRYITKL